MEVIDLFEELKLRFNPDAHRFCYEWTLRLMGLSASLTRGLMFSPGLEIWPLSVLVFIL
jgi:hypothetical protein